MALLVESNLRARAQRAVRTATLAKTYGSVLSEQVKKQEQVKSHDIRAGAAMVVAGLAAEGTTTITGVHHIDRGYDDLVGRLSAVGADIQRVPA